MKLQDVRNAFPECDLTGYSPYIHDLSENEYIATNAEELMKYVDLKSCFIYGRKTDSRYAFVSKNLDLLVLANVHTLSLIHADGTIEVKALTRRTDEEWERELKDISHPQDIIKQMKQENKNSLRESLDEKELERERSDKIKLEEEKKMVAMDKALLEKLKNSKKTGEGTVPTKRFENNDSVEVSTLSDEELQLEVVGAKDINDMSPGELSRLSAVKAEISVREENAIILAEQQKNMSEKEKEEAKKANAVEQAKKKFSAYTGQLTRVKESKFTEAQDAFVKYNREYGSLEYFVLTEDSSIGLKKISSPAPSAVGTSTVEWAMISSLSEANKKKATLLYNAKAKNIKLTESMYQQAGLPKSSTLSSLGKLSDYFTQQVTPIIVMNRPQGNIGAIIKIPELGLTSSIFNFNEEKLSGIANAMELVPSDFTYLNVTKNNIPTVLTDYFAGEIKDGNPVELYTPDGAVVKEEQKYVVSDKEAIKYAPEDIDPNTKKVKKDAMAVQRTHTFSIKHNSRNTLLNELNYIPISTFKTVAYVPGSDIKQEQIDKITAAETSSLLVPNRTTLQIPAKNLGSTSKIKSQVIYNAKTEACEFTFFSKDPKNVVKLAVPHWCATDKKKVPVILASVPFCDKVVKVGGTSSRYNKVKFAINEEGYDVTKFKAAFDRVPGLVELVLQVKDANEREKQMKSGHIISNPLEISMLLNDLKTDPAKYAGMGVTGIDLGSDTELSKLISQKLAEKQD